jgi:hypothetical protein
MSGRGRSFGEPVGLGNLPLVEAKGRPIASPEQSLDQLEHLSDRAWVLGGRAKISGSARRRARGRSQPPRPNLRTSPGTTSSDEIGGHLVTLIDLLEVLMSGRGRSFGEPVGLCNLPLVEAKGRPIASPEQSLDQLEHLSDRARVLGGRAKISGSARRRARGRSQPPSP